MTLTDDKVTAIFCFVDDLLRALFTIFYNAAPTGLYCGGLPFSTIISPLRGDIIGFLNRFR